MTLRTILCANDFSAPSARALDHALALAGRSHANLEVVFVHEPTVLGVAPELDVGWVEIDQQLFAAAEERMRGLVRGLRERLPNVQGRVVRGFASREIVAEADRTRADLVVLATTGHSALAHLLLGSVADRVLRTITRPLLLVPSDGREVSLVPRLILAPTDFSVAARSAIRKALELAGEMGGSVEVVHAFELAAYLLRDAGLAQSIRAAISSHVAQELASIADGRAIVTRAVEGGAAPVILGASERAEVDMIAMGSTGRGAFSAMLGGVTDKIVRHARVPVLVVRAPHEGA